jgi:hypothetical protein
MWVTDLFQVDKLDSTGAVVQTVPLDNPGHALAFDGANIWVTSGDGVSANITVISAEPAPSSRNPPIGSGDASLVAIASTAHTHGRRGLTSRKLEL